MTTRTGGVSVAPWESLNLGVHVGDNPSSVMENLARVRKEGALPAEPAWLEQVHGTSVVELDAGNIPRIAVTDEHILHSPRPRADAAFTRRTGIVCAIQVADCMPVLFSSRDGAVVGAAHAGWRGLAGGVLGATIAAMGAPASDLIAWLGPTISAKHFEVGEDVLTAFLDTSPESEREQVRAAFKPIGSAAKVSHSGANAQPSASPATTGGKWLCDLYALARLRLARVGVTEISGGRWCTYEDAQQFYSYRRDGQTGRMAALIWRTGDSR
jgi:YfiH family protein